MLNHKKFIVFVVALCFVGIGFVTGIQKYGSDITEACKPFYMRTAADYTWVFGYPFPALKQDQMAGDCNGEDNYGFYFIDPWGFTKDLIIWSIAGAAAATGLRAMYRKKYN